MEDANKLLTYLRLVDKNLSLYPEGHNIILKSLRQFHGRLEAYLLRWGDLKIQIGKDSIICLDVVIDSGPHEEGSLIAALFRDGIQWLEFTEGIRPEEVLEFLTLVNRYRTLTPEPAGDIATALWAARFDSIQYEAEDYFPVRGAAQDEIIEKCQAKFGKNKEVFEVSPQERPVSDADPPIPPSLLMLNARQEAALKEMIFSEQTASDSHHLNVLLESLIQDADEEGFQMTLDILAEEFTGFLARHDFQSCLGILEGLRQITCGKPRHNTLIDHFFSTVSDPDHLKPISEMEKDITSRQACFLKDLFLLLKPGAAKSLFPLLISHQKPVLQSIVEDAVISMAHKEATCLEPLSRHADDRIVARLIPVLFKINSNVSLPYLMRLAHHSATPIRKMAVRAILHKPHVAVEEIFRLLDDPDGAVSRMVLGQLGQARSESAESLLVAYLKAPMGNVPRYEHILECFKTLGQCATARSIPFLREVLLHRDWTRPRRSIYRRGAAYALDFMQTAEARKVLERARKSLRPGLRKLARETLEKKPQEQGGLH